METILKNAVASIQVGVEDYRAAEGGDRRRGFSAARNLAAGVLLLVKERLRQLSPADSDEVLLKTRMKPVRGEDGSIRFVGSGRRTVDVREMGERCESLGIQVDFRQIEKLTELRNDIEHYRTSITPDGVREVLAKSFVLIRDFVIHELEREPAELLGTETWSALLNENDVYSKELAEARSAMAQIKWNSPSGGRIGDHIRCPACGSELVRPVDAAVESLLDLEFQCKSCAETAGFEDVIEAAVVDSFAVDSYVAMTDGGDPPLATCHECAKDTFLVGEGRCIACSATLSYTGCHVCGERLGTEDQFDGLCSYHRWQLEHD